MIPRQAQKTFQKLTKSYPVVALTGPRQSGKTTLVKALCSHKPYVSLEDLDLRDYAISDPRGFLAQYPDGAVLDEVQRCPDLFSYLQTVVDKDGRSGLFILTGSQQFDLLSRISQSLAGRVALLSLLPFTLKELQDERQQPKHLEELLFKGLYPPIYDRKLDPVVWYGNYVRTYIERDVRQLLNIKDLRTFQLFLRMCAARSGQLLNLTGLGNDCGITNNTAKAWLSVLETSYIVHLLPPHHNNFNKRLVKTPKLYFHDPGLAAWLQGIGSPDQLSIHSQRGTLFETWVVSELLKSRYNNSLSSNLSFWRDRSGHEIDILMENGPKLKPLEIKSGHTIASDFFKGIEQWGTIAGPNASDGWLVYGGSAKQKRRSTTVLPWAEIHRLASANTANP
jgi:predicted AAA+ superfamily ATPase